LDFRLGGGLVRQSLLKTSNNSLQLLEATILLLNLTAQSLNFMVQVDSVLIGLGKFIVRRFMAALHTSRRQGWGTDAFNTFKFGAIPRQVNHHRSTFFTVHVAAAKMFPEVFLARETMAGAAVAIGIRTHECLLGIGVFLVNFALVAQETTGVGETLDLIAVRLIALVRAIMFVHMFADIVLVFGTSRVNGEFYLLPFARTAESRRRVLAVRVITENMTLRVLWRIAGASNGKARARAVNEGHGLSFVHSGNWRRGFGGRGKNRCSEGSVRTFTSGARIVRPVAHIARS
jgi:hypothetical protein